MSIQSENNSFPGADEYDIISGQDIINEQNSPSELNITEQFLNNISGFHNSTFDILKYEEEWSSLFGSDKIDVDDLKIKAVSGQFKSTLFRSLCWRCLLGVLHDEPKQWKVQLSTYRSHYNDLKGNLQVTPWNFGEVTTDDNPLSQDSESVWCKYFCDQELKSVIEQDVVRTFPGVDFFHQPEIQQCMVSILFCYARQNPSLCYRQGMHEILAPIIFVVHSDHQALIHVKENYLNINLDLYTALDPKFLEHDCYAIFKHVMNHIESSYRITNVMTTSSGYFPPTLSSDNVNGNENENEVIARLEYIREYLLQPTDEKLYLHLQELDIPLQLFGIRWLRLLFGREFPLQDLLILWDTIFSSENFDLVNYIVVAMLMAIRDKLLASDYTGCLTNLMKYPSSMDIMYIIQYALHLKDPHSYTKPSVTTNVPVIQQDSSQTLVPDGLVNVNSSKNYSSLPPRSRRRLQRHATTTIVASRNGETSSDVVEGLTLNDPSLMLAELEHNRDVMRLVHLKLTQYHTLLENNVANKTNMEVQQALDGLSELCSLLKNHQGTRHVEIEPAKEAGEVAKLNVTKQKNKPVKQNSTNSLSSASKKRSNILPVTSMTASEMTTYNVKTDSQFIVGAPMADPIQLIKTSSDDNIADNYPDLKDINKPSTSKIS